MSSAFNEWKKLSMCALSWQLRGRFMLGAMPRDRAPERAQGHRRCSIARESPADDAPREQIHDRGEVTPMLAQAQVGEISDPDLVGAGRQRLLQTQVACLREELLNPRRAWIEAAHAAAQPQLAHQARDA